MGLIDNIAALVHIMVWHQTGDKPLSELLKQCWYVLLVHVCVIQWVYSLRLRQNGHHSADNIFKFIFLMKIYKLPLRFCVCQENAFQNVTWKMAATLSRPQCVKAAHHVSSPSNIFLPGFNPTQNLTVHRYLPIPLSLCGDEWWSFRRCDFFSWWCLDECFDDIWSFCRCIFDERIGDECSRSSSVRKQQHLSVLLQHSHAFWQCD